MAVKPSNAALTALRNTRRAKQEELGRAYEAMGGSNTALVSNSQFAPNTIPSLKRAIENRYAEAQNGGRDTYGDLQAMTPAYNDYRVRETEEALNRLGQTDIARGSNTFTVERAKQGHMQSGLVNSFAENEKLGGILSSLTGSSFPYQAFQTTQNEAMKGTLTSDMQRAGLTQEDIDRWNRQQNELERREVETNYASQHPLMATLNSFPEMAAGSAEGVLDKLSNYVQGKPLESSPINAELYRSAVTQNMSGLGNFAYGVGTSIGDMLLASTAGSAAGPAVMGLEKANSVMNDAIERGLTPNQIIAEGVASGVSTGLTEAIPFGRFQRGGHIAGSALAEGLQEGSEDIVDTIFDELITRAGGNNEKSVWNRNIQAYRDAGYSEEDAKTAVVVDYLKQLGLDSLAGAISGGAMQGGTNVLNQRNFVTGRPRTNTETESNVTADAETVPTLRDSRAEEQAIQDQRNAELAQLTEAYAQIQQRQAEEQARAEQLAREEYARNNDPEEIEYLRNALRDANSINVNPVQKVPQVEQPTVNETASQPIAELRNEALENALRNREVAQQVRMIDSLKSNLEMFGNKSFNRRLDSLRNDLLNGKEVDLNSLVNEINETTNGEALYENQRGINQSLYDDMKRVTDGYVIRVDDNMLNEMNLTLKQLNDRVNTTARDGVNHIRFVKGNTGTPIDSVYGEMYEQSNHALPDPRNMAKGDLLKAVVNYVTDTKSKKNEKVQTYSWKNRPDIDSRSQTFADFDNLAGEVLNKISDGSITEEEFNKFSKAYQDTYWKTFNNPEGSQVVDIFGSVANAYRTFKENQLFDEDTANLTEENVGQAMGEQLTKTNNMLRYNLQLHAENDGEQQIPQVEDNGVHTGIYKTSKLATNTYPNSGIMTEEEYKDVIPEEIRKTERVTHDATLEAAEKSIKENGYTGTYNDILNKAHWNAVDVDAAVMCAMREAENARKAEALGVDRKEAWKREVNIFKKATSQATAGGQLIESFKKWSALTAEGKLTQAIAFVNEAVKEVKNENDISNTLPKDIQTAADKYLSDDFMAEFLAKAHQYDGQEVSLLKQARLNAELAHMVNQQIPVKFRQKFTSLWLDNLLASFRTLISRNFGGNVGKAVLDQTLVKAFSGPIDKFISRYSGTRTTTGFTKEGFSIYRKSLWKGTKQTIKDYWTPNSDPDTELKLKNLAKEIEVFADANVTNRSGVDELNFKEALKGNRTVFKNKALKLYDKIIKFGLALGDNGFYKAAYDQTVYELNTLREQGKLKLPEDITDEQYDTWVKGIATAQGLEAVYQDNSKLARGAMNIKKGLGEVSEGFMGFDPVSNTSMPFVSTPMNVVKTNLELSPLGIVKNAYQTIKEIRANLEAGRSAFDTASFDQRRFVRETSRNLVGLIMFATGLMLKNAGMLTGGYSDDPKEKQAQKDAGMQEYALVNPFNGNQYSINWLPGLGSAWVGASAFDDAYNQPDQSTLDAVLNGSRAGAQALFEQAALQGLQRLTGSANYNSDNKIIDNVVQTVANTASSALVPAFVRQTAAALDPYKRNTYGTSDKGYENVINNAIAGIPFLRQTLQPRIGLNGQPMEQNAGRTGFEKWFDNLVNPSLVTVPSALENPVRDEATRLYNSTGDYGAYQPKIGIKTLTTEDHIPTTEEYTQFLQIADTAMNQVASEVINSDFYANLTDEQRVATLSDIYSAVQAVERAKFLNLDKKFDGSDKAYEEGGVQGLIDYYVAKDALANIGATNNPQNRELVTEVMSSGDGTFEQMEQLGFDVNLIKRYQHAAERIPSLNPASFEQQFNAIDTSIDGTGNNSITQKEIIAYLNQNPTGYNEEEALRIWDAYLQSYGKIPVFDPDKGTWSAK